MTSTCCNLSKVQENLSITEFNQRSSRIEWSCTLGILSYVLIKRRRIDIQIITLLAYIYTLTALQQVVCTIRITTLRVAGIIHAGIPYIVPKYIVGTIRRVVRIAL
ncbi:Uncharacterised protein [Segatella copri]|nr:Uncharacterised protein [Segatella copri]